MSSPADTTSPTLVVDPVCKMKVDAKAAVATVRGQEYRVCSKHCAGALEKDPELRYRGGAEMAQALRDCARNIDPALR